jgi:SAM-dependent methyltransferase
MDDGTGYPRERAAFYHEYTRGLDRPDVAFYAERAVAAGGPVLELACGTGRVYLDILDAGVDVDGFDASAGALSVLRERATERDLDPTVWRDDMTEFGVDRVYDLAVCPFNAMQHLLAVDDLLATLRCVHDALAPGGAFVFDVFVPGFDVVCETYGEWQRETVEYRGERHEHRSRSRLVDEVEQHVVVETELRDGTGETVYETDHHITMLPKQEVELLARLSPFSAWEVAGGFDGETLADGDTTQVWTLEK